MTPRCRKTIEEIINHFEYDCTVETFSGYTIKNWKDISAYQYLSEDFIREFQDEVEWDRISRFQKLSEDFIREFQDKVIWMNISISQKLSEDFIREFKDRVDWECISIFQQLSEKFIREFALQVCWDNISLFQYLSESITQEFVNELHWNYFLTSNQAVRIQYFSDIFFLKFAKQIRMFGTKKQIERLEEIEKQVVDRTYEIIL